MSAPNTTRGPFEVKRGTDRAYPHEVYDSAEAYAPVRCTNVGEANLIAEAFNVREETGMSPRELAEARSRYDTALTEACKRLKDLETERDSALARADAAEQRERELYAIGWAASDRADAAEKRGRELAELVREVLRAGNANTRAVKELMRQAGTTWAQRARAALPRTPEAS